MAIDRIRRTIAMIVGTILSLIVLSPFYLVVVNSAKESADIVINPIGLPANWGQMMTNMNK